MKESDQISPIPYALDPQVGAEPTLEYKSLLPLNQPLRCIHISE